MASVPRLLPLRAIDPIGTNRLEAAAGPDIARPSAPPKINFP
jgi:hypothetical protein